MIRLGLIGENIGRSQAWRLHRRAGQICGLDVVYENLSPAEVGKDFETVFGECRAAGYGGLNITHPYKQQVMTKAVAADAAVAAIGAANTVVFGDGEPVAHNTDATGFAAAYRANFAGRQPGAVALVGAGGAGRAVGYALLSLGAAELRVFDCDAQKAIAVAATIGGRHTPGAARACGSVAEAIDGADGIVNCTPIGMTGHPGSAIPPELIGKGGWAFDAVYTPRKTLFLEKAEHAGRSVMSGYELFFFQGIDAFRIFTGGNVPQRRLRQVLLADES